MKITVISAALVLAGFLAQAQSVRTMRNTGTLAAVGGAGIPANNPWIGSQFGYKFGAAGDFSDNLLVSARLLHEIPISDSDKGLHLPVMGNISKLKESISNATSQDELKSAVQEITMSTSGVNVGLYPYWVLSETKYFSFTLHGAAVYKLNSFQVASQDVQYLNQGRFSLGFEMGIGGKAANGRNPMTLSVAPATTVFSKTTYLTVFNESKSSISSLEITGVVPVGRGFGLLLESVVSKTSVFRAGILISTELSK